MLHAVKVITIVFCSIRPNLNTFSVFIIVLPLSVVLCSIDKFINSFAIGIIIEPFSLVGIPRCMNQSPPTIGLVIFPLPLIHGAICPDLNTLTVFLRFLFAPFPFILRSIFKIYKLLSIFLEHSIINPGPSLVIPSLLIHFFHLLIEEVFK